MHKTKQLLLLGAFGLIAVAGIGGYYFSAGPRQSQVPEPGSQSPAVANVMEPALPSENGVWRDPNLLSPEEVQILLSANGCLGCHAIDKKVVGPAYHDVAARYKGDDQALAKVTASIRQGGAERWGDAMMPAMPNLTEAQAQQLAGFVLQQ